MLGALAACTLGGFFADNKFHELTIPLMTAPNTLKRHRFEGVYLSIVHAKPTLAQECRNDFATLTCNRYGKIPRYHVTQA